MKPLEEASTIPKAWYFDAAFAERERERIFTRTWQCAGRVDQLPKPGDYITTDIAGMPVVVLRNQQGELRAFHNVCRHRAGSPARGTGNASFLRCHYHGWTYDLDGNLKNAPEMDGTLDFKLCDYGLTAIKVAAWGPLVFVNLDPKAKPLEAWLGDIPTRVAPYKLDTLRFADHVEYEIGCNWKLYIDNFLEGYHVPWAHPGLNQVLDYRTYTVEPHDNYVLQYGPLKEQGDASNPLIAFKRGAEAHKGLKGEAALGSAYYWIFPNFMWNLSPDVAQSNVVLPLGPERCRVIFDFFYYGDVSPEVRKQNIAYSDEIQREDIDICETVQRNLHSPAYEAGRFCAKRENGVYAFQSMLRRWLDG